MLLLFLEIICCYPRDASHPCGKIPRLNTNPKASTLNITGGVVKTRLLFSIFSKEKGASDETHYCLYQTAQIE